MNDSPVKRTMIDVRDRANGDFVVPLYDVEGEPMVNALAPQIIADAIENGALRAASAKPSITIPAVDVTNRAKRRAQTRKKALLAAYGEAGSNHWLGVRRAYRHMFGYGSMVQSIELDMEDGMANFRVRDPLTVYGEPRSPEDIRPLEDIAFVYARSVSWLMDNYPSAKNERGETVDLYQMWKAAAASRLDMFDVVEWQDEETIVIGVLSSSPRGMADPILNNLVVNGLELLRGPNKAEMVTATMGQIVTLDKVISSVSRIMGATDMLERLTALEAIAAEKAVFPDRFVIGKDGRPPTIIGGQWKDGRTGESNLILDATQIGELVSQVGPATQQISSKLERAARLSGGNPGIFGGELTGSLRSGQTVNALAGMAVDPRIAEFQEIMAAHLVVMNRAWVATMKGYFGGKKFSMFSGNRSDGTIVEFTPSEDFETYENKVEYAFPGMDINAITVSVAQMNGAGLISKKTAMANHPLVEDDEFEVEQLQREMLKDAMMQALSTQAAQGAIPAIDIARIVQLSEEGKSIPEAVLQVQKEAQARQAASAPPPGPGQGAAPEAMPGLSMPGMGAESLPPEAVAAPDQSLMNLKQLTGALMSPNTAVGANARA